MPPGTDGALRRCYRMGGLQYGLFSTSQANRAGLDRRAIHRQISRGLLSRKAPGVLRSPGAPASLEQELMALVLYLGDGSAASGRAAAWAYGLDGFRFFLEASTTGQKSARYFPGNAVVHRVDDHLLAEITETRGFPVTTPRRTVLDLAAIKHPRLGRALDEFVRRRFVDFGQVWLYLEQEWQRGRRGTRILRDELAARTAGMEPSDSDLKIRMRSILRERGLPAPVEEYRVPISMTDVHLDLAFPEVRLGIELDSYSWHMDRRSFERDRERDNELRMLGWEILRFTWAMLRYRRSWVGDVVAHHLSVRSALTVRSVAVEETTRTLG